MPLADGQHVIIVTGATGGIGNAIVDTLLALPDTRLMLVDLDEGLLATRRSSAGTDRVQYVVGDIAESDTNERAVARTVETWGKIDGLVLNAGTMAPVHRLDGSKAADWTRIFNVNLISQVAMLSVAIPYLRQTKGRVINTSSGAGTQPTWPGWGAYGATKAAINYLIQVLALEEPDITVVGIRPGVVDTPMFRKILRGDYGEAMPEEEVLAYRDAVMPSLVKPELPGKVIAELVVRAEEGLRGEVLFWDDEKLVGYR